MRKTEELHSLLDDDIIVHAVQITLQAQEKRSAWKILEDITISSTRPGKYRKAYNNSINKQSYLLHDNTKLEILLETLTNPFIRVMIYCLKKKECYLPEDCLNVTNTCATIYQA